MIYYYFHFHYLYNKEKEKMQKNIESYQKFHKFLIQEVIAIYNNLPININNNSIIYFHGSLFGICYMFILEQNNNLSINSIFQLLEQYAYSLKIKMKMFSVLLKIR